MSSPRRGARPGASAALLEQLADDVLTGEIRAVARMLTCVESEDEGLEPALTRIYAKTGRAHVVGVTGVPGAGKSTLLGCLAAELRKSCGKVALIAIDPSSPLTRGAILGDRIRMGALMHDDGVYIRSMASRGGAGGLARTTYEAIDVVDAAGFDFVIVETIGVGQDEVDIASAVDTTIVVSAPGLGDDVQAIKAGLLEMADIHVVNKADRPEAEDTRRWLESMLMISRSRRRANVPVLATCARTSAGVGELALAIVEHRRELDQTGEGAERRARRYELRVLKAAEELAVRRIQAKLRESAAETVADMRARKTSPRAAARGLLAEVGL